MPRQSPIRKPGSPLVRLLGGLLLAAYFVAGLAYLGLRHYVWPRLDDWRPMLVEQLSALSGRPVTFGRLDTGFEGLRPRITIEALRIDDDDGSPVLAVPRATAVLSLAGLFTGELRLSVLQLDRPALRVERLDADRLRIAGVEVAPGSGADGAALERLLAQRRVLVHDATIEWSDRERGLAGRLEGVELSMGNVGRRHRGALTVPTAGPGWERLQFAFEIYRPAHSAPHQWQQWSGHAYLGVDGFDVGRFASVAPTPPALVAGKGALRTWLTFEAGRVRDARVKLDARELVWSAGATAGAGTGTGSGARAGVATGAVRVDRLEADVAARPSGSGHLLRVQQFAARAGELAFSAVGEQEILIDADGRPVGGRLSLAAFDPAAALGFASRLPLDPALLGQLARFGVAGRIEALTARFSRDARLEFDAAVDFARLSLRYRDDAPAADAQPLPRVPWFENLSGEARITRAGGELRVRSQRSTLGFPGIFAEPAIPLDSLRAQASWSIEESDEAVAGVAVRIEELRFANADAAGVVSGSYRTGGNGPGIVDLQGRLERADATRAARYLPLQIDAPVRAWVEDAILAGRSGDARFRLRGDLDDFPYRNPEQGEFSITAQVDDGVLRYAPGWPQIERFQGTLAFERAGMRIRMRSGHVFGVALGATEANVRDFASPLLRVEGSGEGPAEDMLRFVNESPLATRIDDFSREARAGGNAQLALRLDLPLGALERSQVAGTVRFIGNALSLDSTMPPFEDVRGALEFSEEGLALRGITATFLDGPLRVDGETPEPGRFVLRAQGTMSAAGMRDVVDNPLTRALEGRTDYRALIDVRRRASTVTIESDLAGLSSSLPEPLRKAADARWPLKVTAIPEIPGDPVARPRRDEIRVVLRDSIRIALQRERDPRSERLLIRRGALALDAEPLLRESGLSVVLSTAEVDVDAWTPLLGRAEPRQAGERAVAERAVAEFAEGFSLMPDTVSVVASRVRVGGKVLHDVAFGATRVGGYWRANVVSRETSGYFSWRDPEPGQRIGTLTARFTRLEIPRTRVGEFESLLDSQPSELPALDVVADDFVLFDHRLGRLELRATNSPRPGRSGWQLDRLRIVNPSATLEASGSWAPGAAAGVRPTRLRLELALADSGGLLAVYGLKNVMRGGVGTITGELHWMGSPLAIDYPSLGGEIALKIGKGQFLKTEPGIAKLIGVLNLQSLPRRLALDFRDVFAEGFSFDEIVGDVSIRHGIARTENLLMRGVQAQVRIRGEADIERETQALAVEVRPELNAGIASLAYGAMVNPAVGLGSFIAQLALRGPIQQMFAYEYDVQGSWSDPQVVEKRRTLQPMPEPMP